MSCGSKKSDLVSFNVGGKIYQVLREPTLSLHPTSLLTQMAEAQEDDKPIFLEGDPDIFKFVLDYHRDRKVHLPMQFSKLAVRHELKRFGLEATEDQIIKDGVSLTSVKRKLRAWSVENQARQQAANAALVGNLLAQAAAKVVMEKDQGGGFKISEEDLDRIGIKRDELMFQRIFNHLELSSLEESESLQAFARSFGYSIAVKEERDPVERDPDVNGHVVVYFTPLFKEPAPRTPQKRRRQRGSSDSD
eukprot:s687_g16.t1